jgi:putative acetyltransferase
MSSLIRPIPPDHPNALQLIAMSEAYMSALYPAESNHFEPVSSFQLPTAFFIGGFVAEQLLAIGAFKIMDDDGIYGEIKRVFVHPSARGQGLSKAIMATLENELRTRGVSLARLETGISQPEALGLYQAIGYVLRPPFGHYKLDPLSVFMEKQL